MYFSLVPNINCSIISIKYECDSAFVYLMSLLLSYLNKIGQLDVHRYHIFSSLLLCGQILVFCFCIIIVAKLT